MADRPMTDEQAAERNYYLGKTDTVPESIGGEYAGMTIADGKALIEKRNEEMDEDLKERMKAYGRDPEDIETTVSAPAEVGGVEVPDVPADIPDEDALGKLSKEALISQAEAESVALDGSENKADIVAKITAHRA